METQIKNILTKKLITIAEDSNLSDADDLMNNYNIRHLPVVDSTDTLVGILSRSDYIALKYVDSRLAKFTVKNFMSTPVVVVSINSKIREVAQLFVNKKISSVIAIENGEAVGIVTSEDLIKLLAKNKEFASEVERLDLAALADEGWISMTAVQ